MLLSGTTGADTSKPVNLKIEAVQNTVRGWINGEQVCEYTAETSSLGAGRAAFFSSYDRNSFDDLVIAPAEGVDTYIIRVDNTDMAFNYSGDWEHNTMSSFKNYKRTLSSGTAGCSFTVDFDGTGIALTGGGKGATLNYSIDGGETVEYTYPKTGMREVHLLISGLEKGKHNLSVTVADGGYNVDGAEVIGGEVYTAKQLSHQENAEPAGASGEAKATAESGADGAPAEAEKSSGFPAGAVAGIAAGAVAVAAGVAVAVVKSRKKK